METPISSETNQETVQEIEFAAIPDQIIFEILLRLPVKSLYRFKCVSKSWKSLISAIFTLKTNSNRAIFWSQTRPVLFSINHVLLAEEIPIPIAEISDSPSRNKQFLGSCNGLFLFRVYTSIYLWNPYTTATVCREISRLKGGYVIVASGICFDESIGDYVVVMMLKGRKKARHISLKDGQRTDIDFPYHRFSEFRSGPVVNGNLHWIIKEKKGKRDLIIYFDSRTRRFIQLPMPYNHTPYNHTSRFIQLPMPHNHVGDASLICGLGVLDGCLTLSRDGNIWNPEHITEVLIMKDYGVMHSWTMLCRIPMISSRTWFPPLFYIKGSKEDVLVSDGVSFVVFNLTDNSMKNVDRVCKDVGRDLVYNAIYCCSYVESLATIPRQLDEESCRGRTLVKIMDIAAET